MILNKGLFEDVIAYRMSEIWAMGPNKTITCMKNFGAINGCVFNGPMKDEESSKSMVVIGVNFDENPTTINPGWKHIWLDYGIVLYVKKNIISGINNCEVTYHWVEILQENLMKMRL